MTRCPERAEIQALEEALHRPETRRSREALEALLADAFMEFGASGNVYGRAEIIDHLMHENDDGSDLRASKYALMPISGDAVLLTYETMRTYRDRSKLCVLRSSVWKHDGTRWQMLFHQGTVQA